MKFLHASRIWIIAFTFTATLTAAPVWAAGCEPSQDPSPASHAPTGIHFYNDTAYAMRVFWAGFDGFLQAGGSWIQPGEKLSFDTYVGHAWFVEVNTPDGAVCSGPIRANGADACHMHILYDNGIGYDAGFCDFEP